MEITDYEKKEMIPLIDKGNKSYERQKVCYICKKEFSTDNLYHKVINHCHYTGKYKRAAQQKIRYQDKKQQKKFQ